MSSNYKTKKLDDSNEEPIEKPNEIGVEEIDVNMNKSNEEDNSDIKCEKSETNNEKDLNNSKVNTSKNLDDENTPKIDYEATIKWYKTAKFKKIAIISAISLVVIGLVVGLSVALTRNKPDKKINPNEEVDQNITINVYKTTTYYFDSVNEETIKNVLNLDNSNSFRRLEERKKKKIINNKYFLAIVSGPNEKENRNYYTAYLAILNRTESNGTAEKNLDDSEIVDNIDNEKNFIGIMKFSYTEDGDIIERLLPNVQEIDPVLYNELNDTITALIPKKSNKRKLEKYNGDIICDSGDIDENEKLSWKSKSMDGALGLDDDVLVNSKYQSVVNFTLKDDEILKIEAKKTLLIKNSDYEKTESEPQDEETVVIGDKLNDDTPVNGLIDSIETNSIQIITFKKEDEALLEKIKEKLKNVEFTEDKTLNKLRVLSKQEYEEKLNSQNEYTKNLNNLRDLARLAEMAQSMEFPLYFNYELFKTSALGLQIAFGAKIEWVPKSDRIIYQLYYQRGKTVYEFNEKSINITNYGDVIVSYKAMIMTIISYLELNFQNHLNNNYQRLTSLLEKNLGEYGEVLNNVLVPLTELYENYFNSTLEQFKEEIFENAKDQYVDLYNNSVNIVKLLENITTKLNNGTQDNLKNIIKKTEDALKIVIDKYDSDLKSFKNNVTTFLENSKFSINALKSYEKVRIDFYYRIKEIFYRIYVMMDSFKDNLANALDSEFLLLQTYVNDDIYMNQIDQLIDNVEVIWDIFKNNEFLRETVVNENNEIDKARADNITNTLENIRKKYEDTKNTLLSKVEEEYNNFKKNQIEIEYETIKSLKQNLKTKDEELINLIKKKVLYITNYEIYNEDIKKITNIENEVSTLKINAYKTYITNKLDEITSELFLSSNTIEKKKTEIETQVDNLVKNMENNNDNGYKENFNKIIQTFKELSTSSKVNDIIAQIKNKFSSNLNTYITNYYNNVINNGISKYSTLTDNIINNSLEKYISEPVELIEKMKKMTSDTEKNTENENNKLQNLVNEKMKIILGDVLSKIKTLMNTEYTYIRAKMNSVNLDQVKKILATGEFYEETLSLIDDLTNKTPDYLSNVQTSLGLKNLIQQKEEAINSKIVEIAEKLRTKFYYLFCYVKDTLNTSCPNAMISKMDKYDKYYFQVSKLRDASNHLTLLQPYIVDVVNDDNLKDLSANAFLNLYKNGENFDSYTIQGQILDYLEVLRKEGIEETKNNYNKLKEAIKSGFPKDLPDGIIEQFYVKLLKEQKDLEETFDLIFIAVQRLARNGYTDDINYLKNNEFYFNGSYNTFYNDFKNKLDKYIDEINETKNKLLDNISLTDEFNQYLLEKFKEKTFIELDKYHNDLTLITKSTNNCILLDNKITIAQIVDEAIDELKEEISSNIKQELSVKLKKVLKENNDVLDTYLKDLEEKIKFQYKYFFDSYYNLLTNKTNSSSNNKITSITKNILQGFEDGKIKCIEELEKALSKSIIKDDENENEKKAMIETILNEIFSADIFTIPNNLENINVSVENLKLTCSNELKREKDSFKDKILEYIALGFNKTITNFLKGSGKSYLDGIFLNDYDINIVPKLDYIKAQSEEIDYYMYLVIEGLNDIDSYLSDSVSEVYYQLMNYINDGITLSEINAKLIKKIVQFKIDSTEKIVDYFKTYTLGVLNKILSTNIFSEQVKVLLPSYVPYTLTLNFAIIYKDILDSLYLSKLTDKYQNNILNKRDEITKELGKLRDERFLHVSKLSQGMENSNLASNIVEYNILNASLSKLNYKFTLDFTADKKSEINSILLNPTILSYLRSIPNDYYTVYNAIQNRISNNVRLNIALTGFKEEINELANKLKNIDPSDAAVTIRTEFFQNLSKLYENLEEDIINRYALQTDGSNIKLLKLKDNRRRLQENVVDIKIESIQEALNQIDNKIVQLTQNISNSDVILTISNNLNKINSAIETQLITLDNTMETNLKYSRFYLNSQQTLQDYQQNITRIYREVEKVLQEFSDTQLERIRNYYLSIDEYKTPYYQTSKPELIKKINNVINFTSEKLIKGYLVDQTNSTKENYNFEKKTDLTNLGALNTVLGSTRLYYSLNVQNASLQWYYNFTTDAKNHKVYLDLSALGESTASITYANEFFETSVAGSFGKAKIGMKLTNDFSIERVFIDYYTKYENNSLTKTLNEVTVLDSWDMCDDAVQCFVAQNEDFCPYIVRVEDGNKTIVENDSNDLGFYQNSTIYRFTGYYENKLCTYANYFYSVEESKYEFNSTLRRWV